MYHYVYQITNLLNNMLYVGKRSSKKHPDIDPYFGSGVHLKRAIKKYGKENFKKEIVAIVDTAEEAEELEELIVDVDFIARNDTYNLALGGNGGDLGEAVNKKISTAMTGKKLSDETRAKMSSSRKGRTSPNKGNNTSDETKAKISAAMKGRRRAEFSIAHKNKLAEKRIGCIWINNGNVSKIIKPDELDKYVSSGFMIGRL